MAYLDLGSIFQDVDPVDNIDVARETAGYLQALGASGPDAAKKAKSLSFSKPSSYVRNAYTTFIKSRSNSSAAPPIPGNGGYLNPADLKANSSGASQGGGYLSMEQMKANAGKGAYGYSRRDSISSWSEDESSYEPAKPFAAPAAPRPLAPRGLRQAITQENLGQSRELLPMAASGYTHDRDYAVMYMQAERAKKYVVEMGARLTRGGEVFSTSEVKQTFLMKSRSGQTKHQSGQATFAGKMTPEDQNSWLLHGMIWICASPNAASKPVFYSGVGKLNHLHHSSFNGGQAVVGAGEWIVDRGELVRISANSGHYAPTMNAFYAAVLHMSEAFTPNTKVTLYDTRADLWVNRPIREFIQTPSMGGLYKVNPAAA